MTLGPASAAPTPQDVAAIERATLSAVVPSRQEMVHDDAGTSWLLPIDPGTVGRAHSAVPLSHAHGPRDPLALVAQVEARYAAHDQPARWRLADVPALAGLQQALQARGYVAGKPTLTQVGQLRQMRDALAAPAGNDAVAVRLASAPDAAWADVFLGPGFDPVDGRSRVQALGRASGGRFASAGVNGRTVAVGALSLAPGWASVHGMRTEQASRRRGLAARLLHAMAEAGLEAGLSRVFLQVEEGNAGALDLYRRAGFVTAWRYRYWQRPD